MYNHITTYNQVEALNRTLCERLTARNQEDFLEKGKSSFNIVWFCKMQYIAAFSNWLVQLKKGKY